MGKLILSNDYSKVRPFTQTATGLLKTPYLSFLSIDSDEEFQFFKFLLKNEYIETNLKFLNFFKKFQIIETIIIKSLTEKNDPVLHKKTEKVTKLYHKDVVSILEINSPKLFEFYKIELV